MPGPSQEFLNSIAHLSADQQKTLLELAWREDALKNGGKHDQIPWHSTFKQGNTEGRKPKGKILSKVLRDLMKRKDAEGKSLAEHFLLEMLARSMEGNGTVFSKIADLVQSPKRLSPDDLPGNGAGQLIIRVRPHPKLEASADVGPSDPSDQ